MNNIQFGSLPRKGGCNKISVLSFLQLSDDICFIFSSLSLSLIFPPIIRRYLFYLSVFLIITRYLFYLSLNYQKISVLSFYQSSQHISYLSLNYQKISVLSFLQLSEDICIIFHSIITRYLFYFPSIIRR